LVANSNYQLKMILNFVYAGLLTGAASVGALYWFQERLVFLPAKNLDADPSRIGLSFETIWLQTDDGVQIHGWWLPGLPNRPAVLFLHGNAGNISHRLSTLQRLHALGMSTLIIDYRGYGQSDGSPSESGTYLDAKAAWKYLTEDLDIPADRIIVFGRSLGGGVALGLIEQHQPGGLWLESTFTNIEDLGRIHYPWLTSSWLLRIHYPNIDRIAQIDIPTMIAHSRNDEVVPYRQGQRLFERAAASSKWLLPLTGGHNEDPWYSGGVYNQCWAAFIARVEAVDAADRDLAERTLHGHCGTV
jgi:fermentation-respiration switch protein FrsA (DUF1100 family)